jgi:HemY protein
VKFAFYLLLTLLAAVVVAGVLHVNNGYALLAYNGTSVEMSLGTLVVGVLFTFFSLYILTTLVVQLWTLPQRIRAAQTRRRELAARRATTRGLIDFAEGRWSDSEKNLLRRAADSEMPLITYIAAARAAQLQGAHERRDRYLRQAFEQIPRAHVAVLLTQAELQIAHKQYDQAQATLQRLRELKPRHAFGLKLLAILYRKIGDWEQLRALLPELHSSEAFTEREMARLDVRSACAVFDKLDAKGGTAAEALWDSLSRKRRADPEVVRAYARALIRAGARVRAEEALRDALASGWDEDMLALYGLAISDDPKRQLARVEEWLAEKGESAALLLSAGRLCVRNKLWGKARGYLESSILLGARPEAYEELGKLLILLDEPEQAQRAFSDGLAVSLGQKVKAYKPGKQRLRRSQKS